MLPAVTDAVPVLFTVDVERALRQYRDVGFIARMGDDGRYGFLRMGGARLHVALEAVDGTPIAPVSCLLFVDDPDLLADHMGAAGHGSVVAPENKPWGVREGLYTDGDGNKIRFGRPVTGGY